VAKTNLEWCQDNKKETYEVNTQGPINLIIACKMFETKLVHISSGSLFDGNNSISTENSSPTPAVWYTWTKKWADEFIQQ
jgi:dTDP-4-dehydrorhamnose reductase